jgi:pullulanase/glycogen debranching enzyme
VIVKNNFLQGYSEQKNTCTTKLGGGDILPQYLVGENVAKQHGCKDRFDQSHKISWFDFQGLMQG